MLPGVALRVLQQTDGPIPGYVTTIVEIEVAANTVVPRHTHPGVESTYVLEGAGEVMIEGREPWLVGAGQAFQIPPDTVHSVRVTDRNAKVCSTLVTEKGKPLVSPA